MVMGCFERLNMIAFCISWHGFLGLKKRRLLTVSKIIHHIDDFFFIPLVAVLMGIMDDEYLILST